MEETARLAEQVELAGKAEPGGTEAQLRYRFLRVALEQPLRIPVDKVARVAAAASAVLAGTLVLLELEGAAQALVVQQLQMAPPISAV